MSLLGPWLVEVRSWGYGGNLKHIIRLQDPRFLTSLVFEQRFKPRVCRQCWGAAWQSVPKPRFLPGFACTSAVSSAGSLDLS